MKKQMVLALSVAVLAAGCASSGKKQDIAGVPNWVTSPSYKDGIAATECVPASSNFSLDRKEAVANARQGLAQQLDLKVKAMDKTYQRRTRAEDKSSTGSTFESVSRQVTQTNLNGSRVVKTGYVELGGTKNLCAMVAFGDSQMQKIFDQLVEASGKNVSPQDEDVLYQEFKSHKAQQALDKELGQ